MKKHHHSHHHGHSHENGIRIDQIAYASALHRVSPYLKLFLSLYSLVICLMAKSYLVCGVILAAMLIGMVGLGKTSWHDVRKLMEIPMAFVIVGCLMVLLQITHRSEGMLCSVSLGSWYFGITSDSLNQFGHLFVQCIAAVSCLYFLSVTTPMTELFTALRRMHVPGFLVEIMELVYRYIFVLLESASQIRHAQECRLGYATLKTSFYSMGQLISNLFLRAYRQAERTYTAMESRGYCGEVKTLEQKSETKPWQIGCAIGYSVLLFALTIGIKICSAKISDF